MERDLYAEAEVRLGRELTEGERFIDLAANDAAMEGGKERLAALLDKEKRRCIKRWIRGEPYDMRLTTEMMDVIALIRVEGRLAAEREVEAAENDGVRQMADMNPLTRWEMRPNLNAEAWDVFDKQLGRVVMGPVPFMEAGRYIDMLVAQELAVPTASKSLTAKLAEAHPGWVWDAADKMFVPKREPLRTVYSAIYAPGVPTGKSVAAVVADLRSAGMDEHLLADAVFAHDVALPGEYAVGAPGEVVPPGRFIPRPDTAFEKAWVEHLAKTGDWVDTPGGGGIKVNPWNWGVNYNSRDGYHIVDEVGNVVERFDNGDDAAIRLHALRGATPKPSEWIVDQTAEGDWWAYQRGANIRHGVPFGSQAGAEGYARSANAEGWRRGSLIPSPGEIRASIEASAAPLQDAIDAARGSRWTARKLPDGKWWAIGPDHGQMIPWAHEEEARAFVRAQNQVPFLPKSGGEPFVHSGLRRVAPILPSTTEIAAQRQSLIAAGILRGPVGPSQMLLFDPVMEPVMSRLRFALQGITKRINAEGNAQLQVGGDWAVSALGRAMEKKVPGVLDAAGRIASPAFNAGLGDVFKLKGGLFKRWQYSAVMDKATCEVCGYFDSTIYYSWRAIAEAPGAPLPNGGPNPGCFGDQRCRCRPVPYFGEGKIGDVDRPPGAGIDLDDSHSSLGSSPLSALEVNDASGSSASFNGYITEHGKRVKVQVKPYDGLYPKWSDTKDRIHDAVREGGDVDHERAAYELSKLFEGYDGLTFRTPEARIRMVHFDTRNFTGDSRSVISRWLTDSETAGVYEADDDEVRGMALFDAVIGNHDRHGHNQLVQNGEFWSIDHGLSFPQYNDGDEPWNMDAFEAYGGRFGYTLGSPEMGLLRHLKDNQKMVDDGLPWLEDDERDAMWERVDRMLDSGSLVGANGGELY